MWKELTARMQVEIIHNLQKSLSWAEIVSALRLTRQEATSVLEHCHHRNMQLETENRIIRDMHEEQLKTILAVDNLDPEKKGVPDQLVLRKSTKRYISDLMPRVSPDYLMCEPWELLRSRKYLKHVGLNPDLVGEWGTNMVTLQEYGAEEKAIPLQGAPRLERVQSEQAGRICQNDEENMAQGNGLRPQMGFLNGVGIKNGANPTGLQQPQQKNQPPPQNQLNAAQQIFHRQYSKPTSQERSVARARARAHIQNRDQVTEVVQLSVGRHGAAEIRTNHPSPHATPAKANQEQQPQVPTQSIEGGSVVNPKEIDRQKGAVFVDDAPVETLLPGIRDARGSSAGSVNNTITSASTNIIRTETEHQVQRNLEEPQPYGSRGTEVESSPCPQTTFPEGIALAAAQSTSKPTTPRAETSVGEEQHPLMLPIRTSPRAVASETSQRLHARGNERKGRDQTTTKKRKVRISLEGSPILPCSSTDRITPEIPDPPGFNEIHAQALVSSPMISQSPGYERPLKDSEYPSPPSLRKDPRCVFDSPIPDSKTPETATKRGSLLQALSQSRAHSSLHPNMVAQTEASAAARQSDQASRMNTPGFLSNLDPQLFDSPNPAHGQGVSAPRSEPSLNREVSQTVEHPAAIHKDQQVNRTRGSIVKEVEAGVSDGERDKGLVDAADAMDIDTEEPSKVKGAAQSESTMASTGDTTLSDSQVSSTGDTTLEEDNTLSSSKATDLEESYGNPKPSNNKKPKTKAGTKTGKAKAEGASKPATKTTTKAAAKKKEKTNEAGARTQPRRIAKNGPEPTRELRSKATKKK